MRKVELLPTQDCEAGYGPALYVDPNSLETSLICILLSASHDVLFDKRMIWFSGLDC